MNVKSSQGIMRICINQRKYKSGYIVKNEAWKFFGTDDPPAFIKAAYTFRGDYIGNVKIARFLIVKRKINPIKASKQHTVCSIGFCKIDRRWYGWSHRNIFGFRKGDKLFIENFKSNLPDEERDKIPFNKHGYITIKNNKQAKQAAINFARYVS